MNKVSIKQSRNTTNGRQNIRWQNKRETAASSKGRVTHISENLCTLFSKVETFQISNNTPNPNIPLDQTPVMHFNSSFKEKKNAALPAQ